MKKYVFAFIVTCFGGAVCSLSLDALSRTVPWVLGSHQLGLQVQEIDPPCTGGFLIDDYLFLRCKPPLNWGFAITDTCAFVHCEQVSRQTGLPAVDGCTGIGTKYADIIEPLLVFDFLPIEYNYYYDLQEGPFCTRPVFCALGETDPSKYCSRSINGGVVGVGACTPINVNTPEPLTIGMCRYCVTRTTLTEAEQDYLADHTVKQRVYQYSEDCIPLEIEGGGP